MESLITENQRINASNLTLITQVNDLKSKLNAENLKYLKNLKTINVQKNERLTIEVIYICI